MAEFHKADIEKLIDGVLPWPAVQDMMKSPKDPDRFDKYVEILQSRVGWHERILLPADADALHRGQDRASGSSSAAAVRSSATTGSTGSSRP